MVGYNQLAKVVCIACSEPLGEHSKKNLVRCLFRVQGTFVSDAFSDCIDNLPSPSDVIEQNKLSSLSEGDIADARNEGHVNG